ncbi:sugar phosphate isomerase/epimerase family protein [Chitinophaga defluvii]|uniref:Sugar phosphate isomerase/epimerase n=1 Tax=Chitinophaga defluvii TaxID=3163343 RepID=A0ABV2T1E0_9BACT
MIKRTSTFFIGLLIICGVLLIGFLILFGVVSCNSGNSTKESTSSKDSTATAVGWKVATIAYTFRNFTFFEAVVKAKELGLNYIGGYPGQVIGGGLEGNMDYTIDSSKQRKILAYLAEQGVKLIDFGVVTPETPAQWRQLFEFAKAMDITNIVSEPHPDQLDMVSKLCDEFQIGVAIHNHPAPSHYWNPDTLLAAIAGKSARIGACADVGHWVRSGLNPIESLKKLDGHILELHFKDESAKSKDAEDVVWGTGVSDVKGMLEELHRQKFTGFLSIEYESKPEDNMKEIAASLGYYQQVVDSLK